MSLYKLLKDEASRQRVPWHVVCTRVGVPRQDLWRTLRGVDSRRGPHLKNVLKVARVLHLDLWSITQIWRAECEEACRARCDWELSREERQEGDRWTV